MFELSQFEEIYGPAAPYSEHKLGERVTYSLGKDIFTGTIAWCTAPQVRKGKQLPTLYIIARNQAENAFPDLVRPGRVIISEREP